jgi:hypothetical protein
MELPDVMIRRLLSDSEKNKDIPSEGLNLKTVEICDRNIYIFYTHAAFKQSLYS